MLYLLVVTAGLWSTSSVRVDTVNFFRHHNLFAPPKPVARCSDVPKTSNSLSVSVRLTPGPPSVDELAFHVALHGQPFLVYTVPVEGSGLVTASIPGVRPDTVYSIQVRAHSQGKSEGDPTAWSKLSAIVNCSSGSGPSELASFSSLASKGVKTRWIEVFRATTNGPVVQDFLDQHNAFDMISLAFNLGVLGKTEKDLRGIDQYSQLPFTRYCVEVEDVELQGIITEDLSGLPKTSHFSDYASCNGGRCDCEVATDRTWTHMPKKQLIEMCGAPAADNSSEPGIRLKCDCPEEMMNRSHRYVGRAPLPVPIQIEIALDSKQGATQLHPSYPLPALPSPMGYIYHFPGATRCKHGALVGDEGCTWQLHPLTHTVYAGEITGANMTATIDDRGEILVPADAAIQNIDVLQSAFEGLPVEIPPCGHKANMQKSQDKANMQKSQDEANMQKSQAGCVLFRHVLAVLILGIVVFVS